MDYKKLIQDLEKETSGGGTSGVYGDIIDESGNVLISGHRKTMERINAMNLNLSGKTLLDLGCNLGPNLKYYSDRGATCFGIEYNPVFAKYAQLLAPKSKILCRSLNSYTADNFKKDTGSSKIDVVFAFSIWDYLDEQRISKFIRDITGDVLYFEGHADGDNRIKNAVSYQGRVLKSWEDILENVLKVKEYKLLGMMENNTRPLYRCTF